MPVAQEETQAPPISRSWRSIAGFVLVVQSILLLAHWFVYRTWLAFHPLSRGGVLWQQLTVLVLSVSFVAASVLGFRYSNTAVRWFYTAAATWLGFFNFFFLAACLSWPVYFVAALARISVRRPAVADALFGLAATCGIYGVVNARWIRVKRIAVELPNLPLSWRGRTAAVVSDIHVGHVNGPSFMRRIVRMITRLNPDVVFIPGDLYDGGSGDAEALVAPLKDLSVPFGAYFVTGNHEHFSNAESYVSAIRGAGVRVLDSEKVNLDGLQVIGVNYTDSVSAERYRAVLDNIGVTRNRPSVLLSHVPHLLEVPQGAGISLQLSGHTHRGQIFPFTWPTKRIFKQFTYGLSRIGNLLVYTSSGSGTWGPPMRLGTSPEIVLIRFE